MGNSNAKTSPPKEIIIKCSIEEMIKAFFQDYAILWHDPNVNNEENQQYITKLKQFCQVVTFTKWQDAAIFAKEGKAVCHVITSGTNGESLAKELSASQSVVSIYVFCANKAYHSIWAQNYPKVSCVETEIEAVLDKIQQNLLEWYKEASSLKLNLPAFAPIFNDSDKSEMNHLHRYLKIIPNFKDRQQAKEDFVTLSKKIYSDRENAKLIKEFETNYSEYNMEQTLRWYTLESFLYKVTNNCLRIATSDSVQYCRLPLKDIEQAIKDQYQTQSKNFSGLLYRGAYLSEEEWSSLKQNQDKEIEMHGFLSVSKVKKVALHFMEDDPSKKVFITIIVPKGPNEEEQGFAEMQKYSDYPQEKEVLFNVRSRFTVLETEDEYKHSATSTCRHLVLLYGAQGFRQFIAEKNPIHEVAISSANDISCAHCRAKEVMFVSLADLQTQAYYCKACIEFGMTPFLCTPAGESGRKPYVAKVKGIVMNFSQEQVPFYGYKCCNCQAKKQKAYFTCVDCECKENSWCEDCFERDPKCKDHNIVFEASPFSFWCEKMSENELSHQRFQQDLVENSVFQQAEMYFESHQHEKAIQYYELYVQENKAKGKDANLATSFNNIGLVYDSQGEYNKALKCYLKSLDIRKSLYGNIHPDTAASLSNIGSIYKSQGKFDKALDYYFECLEIEESVYGDSHSTIATSYNNIGSVYNAQGEYSRALKCYMKCLEIEKSVYGDIHPAIASSFGNIGMIYESQGEYSKALEYVFKALDILKSMYGDNHPSVATSFNSIGLIYDSQGEYNKALEYHLKSLDIRKSVYGDKHSTTAMSLNNIGLIYNYQGEYNKALEYYHKCFQIEKSVYGDNHPTVATSLSNIGSVYKNEGKFDRALQYYLKCLEIEKSVYGDNHPAIATSFNNIASVYNAQGEYNKALGYVSKALDIRKSVYGDSHPDTIRSQKLVELIRQNVP